MSATDRQSRLIVAEDWKRLYQTFRNADFQSYDFDNLRRTMINYLRQNYPEDFNDYIESSEYLALIDMIAFLGQNLSFRIDLNARENFLETAERRESILRLARMLSYNPKRNQSANGLLRIETVKTTEQIKDSSGVNLSGTVVKWNDQANTRYFEQFIKILNAALPVTNSIGHPLKSENIDGVQTQKYRFNALNTTSAIYPFTKIIEGVSTRFEVVSTDINGTNIIEEPPIPGTSPAFLFRDSGQGASSNNTGFFMHFRQGELNTGNFSVDNPIPNQIVAIDSENINNTDVWLYSVDSNNIETDTWYKIESTTGNNIIYNSLFQQNRNLYTVITRIGDRINLVFSDGIFGNLPTGKFKIFYRTSSGNRSVIMPGAIGTVNVEIPYQSHSGNIERLTLGLRLNYSISNGSPAESNEEIKQNAPATYYTQNRLITGEDYNVGMLSLDQEIIKTKSINRISSGISKYFDLKDVSGKYSNTNMFASDGIIYKDEFLIKSQFKFSTQSDIEGIIYNTVEPIISSYNLKNFYYHHYPKIEISDLNIAWEQSSNETNRTTGVFYDINSTTLPVGSFTANNLKYIEAGTLCKFIAPNDTYFTKEGNLTTNSELAGVSKYKWTRVNFVTGNGTEISKLGIGAIELSDTIPTGAILEKLVIKLTRRLTTDTKTKIIDQAFSFKDFALRYDINTRNWLVISADNIDTISPFSTGKSGDISGQNLDASWFLYFKTDGERYNITYRNLRYIFESADELRFYFDKSNKIYDPKLGKVIKDHINILNINKQPDSNQAFTKDFKWSIYDNYRDKEGYLDTRKIQIQFIDYDDDSVPDDIDVFNELIQENINNKEKYIFQEKYTTVDGVEDYRYFDNIDNTIKVIQSEKEIIPSVETDGQVFYIIEYDLFKTLNRQTNVTSINTQYKAYIGRANLKFQYVHVANSNYRIDPSSSNIIDTFILTKTYDIEMRKYIKGQIAVKPKPISSDEMYRRYNPSITKIKSISDEIIYHPAKYKILFGDVAIPDLQVKFKIIRNKELVLNENELKVEIIQTIDKFFAVENWDFGETFYFQELSAYIMNTLSPKLLSIIIVPRQGTHTFGSLFEIKSELDEIFVSAAKVTDIEIISDITASEIQSSGAIVTNVSQNTSGITSASTNQTLNNGGGYLY